MITIIAEKPSVAMEIARIVGANRREDGYMSGNGYAVTWALGHLVEIYCKDGEDWKAPLPLLPDSFSLRPCTRKSRDGANVAEPAYLKQLSVIKSLVDQSECIINAGDAGREGELIQRYIYRYVGGNAPVKRLWISSLTDEAIREGMQNLRPSEEFDNLYQAGMLRNEADWLVGINATRAMTIASGGSCLISIGRVQTPTLALVCRRYMEHRDFIAVPFWTLSALCRLGNDEFTARSDKRYETRDSAFSALVGVQDCGKLTVDSIERKQVSSQPPLLFDLTSLQREANRRFSMSAQQTLSAAQQLYEKKLITYPRTGSRYITGDVFATLPALIRKIAANDPTQPVSSLLQGDFNRRSVDDSRVTDHHALLPTGNRPDLISTDCRRIYNLIVTRLLESFSPVCEKIVTTVHLMSASVGFTVKGVAVVEPGWTAIRGERESPKDEDGVDPVQSLPVIREGDVCQIRDSDMVEGKTKPKALYTEDTLLDAMEHAGREIEDGELKDAIKDCGLGTPATRAGEIETIISRGYVVRSGKNIVPTTLGLTLYGMVKDMSIGNALLTARWEQELAKIASGETAGDSFREGIREYTRGIVAEIRCNENIGGAFADAQRIPDGKCPLCGKAVLLTTRVARCVDDGCGWLIWRTMCGHHLTDYEMKQLVTEGKTGELGDLQSKAGKTFSARVILNEEFRLAIEFVDHDLDVHGNALPCPRCGKPVHLGLKGAFCSDKCGWVLWRNRAGKNLTDAVLQSIIVNKSSGVINGFQSKDGKTFSASLVMDDHGEVQFKFPNRAGNSLRRRRN